MSGRVLVLVEGQTEEAFVKRILQPAFEFRSIYFSPTLLVTKNVKNGPRFKGGVTSFARFEADLRRLLAGAGPGCLVTTILDYYGLPSDFPGMQTRPAAVSAQARVEHVEGAIHGHFGRPRLLLPFLSLHEIEAWLFASPSELPRTMSQPHLEADFVAIRNAFKTPEDINERPQSSPSKRIADLFPGYRKVLNGPPTLARIGLPKLRAECPHLARWIERIETHVFS